MPGLASTKHPHNIISQEHQDDCDWFEEIHASQHKFPYTRIIMGSVGPCSSADAALKRSVETCISSVLL